MPYLLDTKPRFPLRLGQTKRKGMMRETTVSERIVILILMVIILGFASWYGSREYDKNACQITTGNESCEDGYTEAQ